MPSPSNLAMASLGPPLGEKSLVLHHRARERLIYILQCMKMICIYIYIYRERDIYIYRHREGERDWLYIPWYLMTFQLGWDPNPGQGMPWRIQAEGVGSMIQQGKNIKTRKKMNRKGKQTWKLDLLRFFNEWSRSHHGFEDKATPIGQELCMSQNGHGNHDSPATNYHHSRIPDRPVRIWSARITRLPSSNQVPLENPWQSTMYLGKYIYIYNTSLTWIDRP